MQCRSFILYVLLLVIGHPAAASNDSIPLVSSKQTAQLLIDKSDARLIEIAANLLADDVEALTDKRPEIIFSEQDIHSETVIMAGTVGQSAWIDQLIASKQLDPTPIVCQWEAYY